MQRVPFHTSSLYISYYYCSTVAIGSSIRNFIETWQLKLLCYIIDSLLTFGHFAYLCVCCNVGRSESNVEKILFFILALLFLRMARQSRHCNVKNLSYQRCTRQYNFYVREAIAGHFVGFGWHDVWRCFSRIAK